MSKKQETTNVKEVKKLNKLAIKKETITDLNVPDAERVKGGTNPSPGGGGGRSCLGGRCITMVVAG